MRRSMPLSYRTKSLLVAKSALSISHGIYAGMAISLNSVAVPAMLSSSDPLPVWKKCYYNGAATAFLSYFVSVISGGYCYYQTKNFGYLISTGLHIVGIPYTLIFMLKTNSSLTSSSREDKTNVKNLILDWNLLQFGRSFLGICAFVYNMHLAYWL